MTLQTPGAAILDRQSVIVVSPVNGWLMTLSSVPDPAFAQGLVGPGVGIDPLADVIGAPCAGRLKYAEHRHAFSIETLFGEVLVHFGIDTVGLRGEGIERLLPDGSTVQPGDPVLRVDLDYIAGRVPSLVTPVIALGASLDRLCIEARDGHIRRGEPLYRLTASQRASLPADRDAGTEIRMTARIRSDHGLHARPAAALAAALRPFNADVTLECRGRQGNARSVTAMMALGTTRGDPITVIATGIDAQAAALAALALFDPDSESETAPAASAVSDTPAAMPDVLQGLTAVRGAALGRAYLWRQPGINLPATAESIPVERERLIRALATVEATLTAEAGQQSGTHQAILTAHAAMVADPSLRNHAIADIHRGLSAAHAWRNAIRSAAEGLRAGGDRRMSERVADFLDVEQRVLGSILDIPLRADTLPDHAVVLAEDLLPGDLMAMDHTKVAAIATARGGATAHVAILAAGLNIPMVVGLGDALLAIGETTDILVDADTGILEVAPTPHRRRAFTDDLVRRRQLAEDARAHAMEPAKLRNGEVVTVECNLGGAAEAGVARAAGADGVGLLRTEFLFLERETAPTLDEHVTVYRAVTDAFEDRPVTIRTLDVGADKPVRFIPMLTEDNPALGQRGIRTGFAHPALLRTQLQALAQTPGHVRVLVPMVNDVAELRFVRALLAEYHPHCTVGVMIETPSSALLAESLAAEADFFSIGSNDLAQYVLAIDRLHPILGRQLDGLHPAVLRAMHMATSAARAASRPVAVCGGLAGDPEAIPLLVGLGVRELSVAVGAVAEVKQVVRHLDVEACTTLVTAAMADDSAATVRARVRAFQSAHGR